MVGFAYCLFIKYGTCFDSGGFSKLTTPPSNTSLPNICHRRTDMHTVRKHKELMAMTSTTYAKPPDDAQLPWSSYEEFWVSVGNISQEIQDGVASAVPQFGDLIGLARDKNFKAALTETNIPGLAGLVACRIAEKIHVDAYGK